MLKCQTSNGSFAVNYSFIGKKHNSESGGVIPEKWFLCLIDYSKSRMAGADLGCVLFRILRNSIYCLFALLGYCAL